MGERGTMLKANREWGRGEIAYVLRVSASVLSSLKPFNKERRGGKEVWGGMKEGAFGRIQISPPPRNSFPSLISCHPFFSSTLSHPPSIPPSFTLFPPQSPSTHSLAWFVHAHVFVYVGCTFHWQVETIMDSTWSFNPLKDPLVRRPGGGSSVCMCSLGTQGHRSVMQAIHTHSLLHTCSYTQAFTVNYTLCTQTHTLSPTLSVQPVQLVRARRGSTDRFWEPLNVIINFRGMCLCVAVTGFGQVRKEVAV